MFLAYSLLLMLSGVALVVLGVAFRDQGTGSRVISVLAGVAFFGYGFYLTFLFTGGTYRIFFYAFVVPILLIVRAVKARNEARAHAAQAAHASFGGGHPQPQKGYAPPTQPGHPAPQGQAGWPAPQGQAGWPPPQGQPGYPPQPGQAPQGQPGHPVR
jgi:hypothetical protein